MKILVDKKPYNCVYMDENIVVILDPTINSDDQRVTIDRKDHVIKKTQNVRYNKPKRAKRKRMSKLELCFSKSPLNPMRQLN